MLSHVGQETHAVLHCGWCPQHFAMMLWLSICCNTFWHPQPNVSASYWPECLQWNYLVCQQMCVHIMDCSGHVHLCHSRYISKVGWCFYDSNTRYFETFSKTFQQHWKFFVFSNPYIFSLLSLMLIQLNFFKRVRIFLLYFFILLRLDISLSEFCGTSIYLKSLFNICFIWTGGEEIRT